MTDQLREAARGVLSYPGPVNMTEEAHVTCAPDECYVTALRAALDAAPPAVDAATDAMFHAALEDWVREPFIREPTPVEQTLYGEGPDRPRDFGQQLIMR
jgi:hypothetical protein